MHKVCKGECKELKPLTDYYFNKKHRSYFGICKVCTNKTLKAKRVPTPRKEKKILCKCGEANPDNFHNCTRHSTGKQYICKTCYLDYQRKHNSVKTPEANHGKEKRRDVIRKRFKLWCIFGVFK